MKHLKVFEDFKDSSAYRTDALLKQIDKAMRFDLKYGSLYKNGYFYDYSELFANKGSLDWLKMDLIKDDYKWSLIFMMDEIDVHNLKEKGEEKVHIEFSKYKLPEFKKLISVQKDFKLKEIISKKFMYKELKKADDLILKNPNNNKEFDENLNKITKSLKDI